MCTKSPVREIATIEGTSIHQRLTNYHNQWEKWAFSNYLQYEIHLEYYTYFSSVGYHRLPWWIRSNKIKNKQMFVCLSCAQVPQNLLLEVPVL